MPFDGGSFLTNAAIGGVSSLLGIGSNSISYNQQKKLAAQQFQYQQQLNAQQQQYARDNADVQYQRQRDLTSDSWLLNKEGMRNAGINPSFSDGANNTASVEAAASPQSGSVGLPSAPSLNLANDAAQGVQTLLSVQQNSAQNELLKQQTENMRQRNITQLQKDLMDIAEKAANTDNIELKNKYQKLYYEAESKYYEENAKNKSYSLANDAFMSDMDAMFYGQMKQMDLQQRAATIEKLLQEGRLTKKEVDNYNYKLRLIRSQISKNDADAADSRSRVGVNVATVGNLNQDTENKKEDNISKKNENRLFNDTYSDRISAIRKSSVPDNLYQKIQMWRRDGTFEKLDGLQQAGYGLYEAMQDSGIKMQDALQLLKFLGAKGK